MEKKKRNLVDYNGRENFEVDLSSLESDKLSKPGRVTLFVSRGYCFELTDEELALMKEHPCWAHCCQHEYPSGVNPEKEETKEEPEKEKGTKKPAKKTLTKKNQ